MLLLRFSVGMTSAAVLFTAPAAHSMASMKLLMTMLTCSTSFLGWYSLRNMSMDPTLVKWACIFLYMQITVVMTLQAQALIQAGDQTLLLTVNYCLAPLLTMIFAWNLRIPEAALIVGTIISMIPYTGNQYVDPNRQIPPVSSIITKVVATSVSTIYLQIERACFLDRWKHGHVHRSVKPDSWNMILQLNSDKDAPMPPTLPCAAMPLPP